MPVNDILRLRTHAFARFLNSHRILLYCFISVIAVLTVIANALKNYSNFYSVAIYLSKSSRSVLVLANFGFLLALLCGHIVQKIFFGSLRPNEIERLYDRLWFFITESLLAFTIFRDEFDIPFALMFGFLLFVKSFHWLAGDRIEWMDQRPYPGPSLLFHVRMTSLFLVLWTTDLLMFLFAVENTITNGVGGMVLFASEYGILMASVMNTILKYLLSAYEFRRAGQRGGENAPPWENKSMWVFYIELATDFLKLTTYLVFFTIIITFYGLPLNIVRDVYITARSFLTRLRALHRYQTATRNMDQRYPNATEEELVAMSDRTCIICREEMVLHEARQLPANSDGPNTTPKKLPCGHIFHFYCLRSWLERQQSCPTCRRTVLDTNDAGQRPVGAAAAPPIPGAGAQQPNPFGPRRAQNLNPQGGNNPLGNPFGLVGRLFGPPVQGAQPGPIPGRIPNNVVQNPGNVAGQVPPGGIFIQYQIQYQFPRQNLPQGNQQHAPRALQPVPQFPGFPGPEGAWHQWPGEEQPRNSSENHTAMVDSSLPDRSSASSTLQDPANTENAPISSPSTSTATNPPQRVSSSSTSVSPNAPEAPVTPQEAAALAALRRFDSRSVSATRMSPTEHSDPTRRSYTNSTSESARAPGSSATRADVPNLIPLYDYAPIMEGSSLPRDAVVSYVPNIQGWESSTASSSATAPSTSQDRNNARASDNLFTEARPPQLHQSSASEIPLAQLPPTLTESQLATMDSLTREAIDERLRVLEGVSTAIYRCIDDLMRMRSALPIASPVPVPASSSQPSSSQISGDSALDESEHLSSRNITGEDEGTVRAEST